MSGTYGRQICNPTWLQLKLTAPPLPNQKLETPTALPFSAQMPPDQVKSVSPHLQKSWFPPPHWPREELPPGYRIKRKQASINNKNFSRWIQQKPVSLLRPMPCLHPWTPTQPSQKKYHSAAGGCKRRELVRAGGAEAL